MSLDYKTYQTLLRVTNYEKFHLLLLVSQITNYTRYYSQYITSSPPPMCTFLLSPAESLHTYQALPVGQPLRIIRVIIHPLYITH